MVSREHSRELIRREGLRKTLTVRYYLTDHTRPRCRGSILGSSAGQPLHKSSAAFHRLRALHPNIRSLGHHTFQKFLASYFRWSRTACVTLFSLMSLDVMHGLYPGELSHARVPDKNNKHNKMDFYHVCLYQHYNASIIRLGTSLAAL